MEQAHVTRKHQGLQEEVRLVKTDLLVSVEDDLSKMSRGVDIRSFFRMMNRNAATARSGNAAERRMCDNHVVKEKLERYFNKPIAEIRLISGRKKSDLRVLFTDLSHTCIQNKNGPGGNRGWSVDRRAVSKMPLDDKGRQLLDVVCLNKVGERPVVDRPNDLIRTLLMGVEEEYAPEYFTHSIFREETGELVHLSIARAERVLATLNETAYPQLVAKRTCVHLSPLLYLQRKGGGSADNAPDDVQVKLVSLPESVMETI